MSEYKQLRSVYAMTSSVDEFQAEVAARKNGPFTLHTNISLPSAINAESENIFIVEYPKLSILQDKVISTDRLIRSTQRDLPAVAYHKYVHELLIDELRNTNEIEGVHSSRKEMDEAIRAARATKSHATKRFLEMARMYLNLEDDSCAFPETTHAIRTMYDSLVGDEIQEPNIPDGELFRKESVSVRDQLGTLIYAGVNPESAISSKLEELIRFSHESWPMFYKALAMHYVFECIHPFYDGNGRLGRFLLATSLNQEGLSLPSILSFSHEIQRRKPQYYSAFTQAQHPLNKGELSFFVYELLDILHNGQLSALADLKSKKESLQLYREYVQRFEPVARGLIFATAQVSLFTQGEGASLDELVEACDQGLSKATLRKHTLKLVSEGVLLQSSLRPLRFVISPAFRQTVEGATYPA